MSSGCALGLDSVRLVNHVPVNNYYVYTYVCDVTCKRFCIYTAEAYLKERSVRVWLRTLKMAFLPIRINLDRRVAPAPSVTYVLPPLVLPITINVPGPVVQAEWMHVVQLPGPRTPSSSPESPCSWESRKSSPPCLSAEVCKPALPPPARSYVGTCHRQQVVQYSHGRQ